VVQIIDYQRHKSYIAADSSDQCFHGKPVRVTYSEYVFIALVIQHAKRMRLYIVICGLSGCTVCFYIIT